MRTSEQINESPPRKQAEMLTVRSDETLNEERNVSFSSDDTIIYVYNDNNSITECSVRLRDVFRSIKDGPVKANWTEKEAYVCPCCDCVFMERENFGRHKLGKHSTEFFAENIEKIRSEISDTKRRSVCRPGTKARRIRTRQHHRCRKRRRSDGCPYCKNKPRTGFFMIHQNRCKRQRMNSDSCSNGCLTGEDQFDCPYCGRWYISGDLLESHVKIIHSRPDKVKDTRRTCADCGKTFLSIVYLAYHKRLAHSSTIGDPDIGSFDSRMDVVDSSDDCDETVTAEREVVKRKKKKKISSSSSDSAGVFEECSVRSRLRQRLKNIREKTISTEMYRCEICAEMLSLEEGLQHVANHRKTSVKSDGRPINKVLNGNEVFECVDCGTMYSTLTRLRTHYLQLHSNSAQCNLCDAVFAHEKTLRDHKQLAHGQTTEESDFENSTSATEKLSTSNTESSSKCSRIIDSIDNLDDGQTTTEPDDNKFEEGQKKRETKRRLEASQTFTKGVERSDESHRPTQTSSQNGVECPECGRVGRSNGWLKLHCNIWHNVVTIETMTELVLNLDIRQDATTEDVKNVDSEHKNQPNKSSDKLRKHAGRTYQREGHNSNNQSGENADHTTQLEVLSGEQDTHQVEKENNAELDDRTGEQKGNPNLFLGVGYTVELASDSMNESRASLLFNDKEEGKPEMASTREGSKKSSVVPVIQYLCALCSECFSGHEAFFLHAVEKHNGLVQGNVTIKPLDKGTASDTKIKTSEKKKKKKFKESQRKNGHNGKMDISDRTSEMGPSFDHSSETFEKCAKKNTAYQAKEKNSRKETDNALGEDSSLKVEKCKEDETSERESLSKTTDTSKKCERCNKKFKTAALLESHKTTPKGESACRGIKDACYKCEPCNRLFISRGMLVRHIRSCPKNLKCYLCDNICTKLSELKEHLQNEHSGYIRNKGKRQEKQVPLFPQCDVCGKQFISKASLKLHGAATHRQTQPTEKTGTKYENISNRKDVARTKEIDSKSNKVSKVKFSSFVETQYFKNEEDDDFLPDIVIPAHRRRRRKTCKAKKASFGQGDAKNVVQSSQQIIDNVVRECQPNLRRLLQVTRDTGESELIEQVEGVRSKAKENGTSCSGYQLTETKHEERKLDIPLVEGGYPICYSYSYDSTKYPVGVNIGSEEISMFVESESGNLERTHVNVNSREPVQGTPEAGLVKSSADEQIKKNGRILMTFGQKNNDTEEHNGPDKPKVSVHTCINERMKKTGEVKENDEDDENMRNAKKLPKQRDDNIVEDLIQGKDDEHMEAEGMIKSPSGMSMNEYNNIIALLASAFIENMKKEVEERQYTIVGSNLLEETSDGKVLGTMTDRILMHVETGMEAEDMTEKQVQKRIFGRWEYN